MYSYYQPRISVEQEEADIKEMIDKEYEQREQKHIDYYKQIEEDYYKQMESVKNMANNSKEEGRKRQIDFLRTLLSKDFAFIFDFSDNDFGMYIERAAKEFCNEYNNLLRKIEMYSSDGECPSNITVNSCKKDLEFMEDPNNVRELIKAGFIGEYMTGTIDRCWLDGKPQFNALEHLNKAQYLVNEYFNFETNTTHYDIDNTERVDWKFGTWDEVSKFGLEQFKSWQGEEELKDANGDFTKYWLNGEVLIVRMVGGKLVAEVH